MFFSEAQMSFLRAFLGIVKLDQILKMNTRKPNDSVGIFHRYGKSNGSLIFFPKKNLNKKKVYDIQSFLINLILTIMVNLFSKNRSLSAWHVL